MIQDNTNKSGLHPQIKNGPDPVTGIRELATCKPETNLTFALIK